MQRHKSTGHYDGPKAKGDTRDNREKAAKRALKNSQGEMTNAVVSVQKFFTDCCEAIGIKPTTRQASKFKRKVGLAWEKGRPMVLARTPV